LTVKETSTFMIEKASRGYTSKMKFQTRTQKTHHQSPLCCI